MVLRRIRWCGGVVVLGRMGGVVVLGRMGGVVVLGRMGGVVVVWGKMGDGVEDWWRCCEMNG